MSKISIYTKTLDSLLVQLMGTRLPGQGTRVSPWFGLITHAVEQLSLLTIATEAALLERMRCSTSRLGAGEPKQPKERAAPTLHN